MTSQDETSGVLHPANLDRYHALWIAPSPAVCDVVDQYWHVRWRLADGESIDQAIIDLPAVTVTIESGDVPAPLVVTGVHLQAWRRRIEGTGDVFALRLRPAGLALVSSLRPADLVEATIPLTPRLDARLHELMTRIAHEPTPQARATVADELIGERLGVSPLPDTQLFANRVLDELRSRPYHHTGAPLAERLATSERTIQRALAATLGTGPKQAARRIRLQQTAQAIATSDDEDLAEIAVQLGYTDQAHLTGDFRSATGTTPGAYRRALRRLASP